LRVRVDPIRCTAFGFCAEFCPELFDLDDWGYAWLKESEVDGSAESLVRETARLCPRQAILVEEIEEPEAVERPAERLGDSRQRGIKLTRI
jgi:ferredoxin